MKIIRRLRSHHVRGGLFIALLLMLLSSGDLQAQTPASCPTEASSGVNVATYHNNPQRTGWNGQETTLRPCNVTPQLFGTLQSVRLRDQVDAQPLVVTHQVIETFEGRRTYEVVTYVADESNTIYAINGITGEILLQRTLGNPVPEGKLPICGNNGPNVGITSTPVIDLATGTMYVVAYLAEEGNPVYRIFSLDLVDLKDKVHPPTITASHELADGTKYYFNSAASRQRAALVDANKNIYVAFASFCDHLADISRGWILGWEKTSLKPLGASHLNDNRLETNSFGDPQFRKSVFLGSIWMSGYGIAADDNSASSNDLFFSTGNSDSEGPFQVGPGNSLQESAVRIGPLLNNVVDYFTPSDPKYGLNKLEAADQDFGAGGVLVIPGEQPGSVKHLAIAAGKVGQMYLLDRDNMGKYDPTGINHVLDTVDIGKCWCGQSYFIGADRLGRVVSSGGDHFRVWKVTPSPSPKLLLDYTSSVDLSSGGFQKGFFTSISSNSLLPDTAIIWAIRRPIDANTPNLTLYAFDAIDGKLLYSAPAGTWPRYKQAAPNIVPVVANGKVYVASDRELRIFGIGGNMVVSAAPGVERRLTEFRAQANSGPLAPAVRVRKYAGSVISVQGSLLSLSTSESGVLQVDITKARQSGMIVHLEPGEPVTVIGTATGNNTLDAEGIYYGLSEP